jgi:hypothetical protein
MFKTNSRFQSLIEEPVVSQKKDVHVVKPVTSNSFKNNRQEQEKFSRPYNREYHFVEKQEQFRKAEEERKKIDDNRKEVEKMAALSMESFPVLGNYSKKNENYDGISFLEKAKTQAKDEDMKPIKRVIKPGWTEFRRDLSTNTIVKESGPKERKEYVVSEEDIAYNVLDHLVYLHETRKTQYMDAYGEDAWEREFLFPNYDYFYFDKLDEIYAKNHPEIEEEDY